jgi:uncharacterized protein YdaU (DUF1376 family)
MHYYQHHVGDYQRDTSSLSILEHGAYRLLMDEYYVTERPLPADAVSLWRICGAMGRVERLAVSFVAERFFQLDGGVLRHKRIDQEIAEYQALLETASRAGKASAESRQRKRNARSTPVDVPLQQEGQRNVNGTSTNQEPRTIVERESAGAGAGAWVERILSAYPVKTHQAPAMDAIQSSLNRGASPEEILQGTRECAAVIRAAEQAAGGVIRWVPKPGSFFESEGWREPLRLAEQLKPKSDGTKTTQHRASGELNAPGRYS